MATPVKTYNQLLSKLNSHELMIASLTTLSAALQWWSKLRLSLSSKPQITTPVRTYNRLSSDLNSRESNIASLTTLPAL